MSLHILKVLHDSFTVYAIKHVFLNIRSQTRSRVDCQVLSGSNELNQAVVNGVLRLAGVVQVLIGVLSESLLIFLLGYFCFLSKTAADV